MKNMVEHLYLASSSVVEALLKDKLLDLFCFTLVRAKNVGLEGIYTVMEWLLNKRTTFAI